ncbi:MAG: hypothetical protein J6Y94_05395 [Bacteriovoracaceae bacterium]|nr:hypothetical protein [Bacteriovoracaceae bacterium]
MRCRQRWTWGAVIISLGGMIWLSGCSTTAVYAPANIEREQAWQSIDWQGTGRGTFTYHDKSESFRMESGLNRQTKTWVLAVRIPLLGEEYLKINYQTGVLEGPLWERWQKQNSRSVVRPLKQAIMQVLRLKKVPQQATWDQYTLAFEGRPGVHWQFDHWKAGRFYRAQVRLEEIYEYPLKLELEWREEEEK